jgi:DNA polymerase-3 subunit delta'
VDNTIANIYEGKELTPHPFIKLVSPENNKEIKINQIREIIDFLKLKSKTGKVVIIEDAEKMNREASNALLKTLEEPPEKSLIILTTSNKSKILPTILSRTLKIRFSPLKEDEIVDILKLKGFSTNDIKKVYKLSDGSLCLILKLLEDKKLLKYVKDFYTLLTAPKLIFEGVYTLVSSMDKFDNTDINLIFNALDKALHLKLLEGKMSPQFYEKFLNEKEILEKALNRGVKKNLALEGFFVNLKG